MFVLSLACVRSGEGQTLDLDISQRLRYDSDAEGTDLDSLTYTRINITDMIKDRLDMRVSGWGIWDINHDDDYDDALDDKPIRLSEFYFDLKHFERMSRLRIGRQRLYEVEYLRYDGATAFFNEDRPVSSFLFAGRAANFYSAEQGGALAGGGVIWKPNWRARHQLDGYFINEDDESAFAAAWRWNQLWRGAVRTNSRLRTINAEIRDWRLNAWRYFERVGINASLDYYVQPFERGDGGEEFIRYLSSYGLILGPRHPNHRIAIDLSKSFGDEWFVSGGGSIRRRFGGDSEENYNTLDSEQAYLTLTRTRFLRDDLDATIGVEAIHNEQDEFGSLIGSLSWRPDDAWWLTTGFSYSHYRFDPIDFPTTLNGQEDLDLLLDELDIPTWFLEARWRPSDKYDLRADLVWQDSDKIRGTGLGLTLGFNYHIRRRKLSPDTVDPGADAPVGAPAEANTVDTVDPMDGVDASETDFLSLPDASETMMPEDAQPEAAP